MSKSPLEEITVEQEELRGISRTVAEIEWLLLILVLLYQVFSVPGAEERAALASAMFFYAAVIVGFRYTNFYRSESRWKIAIETWVMIGFITWVLWFTGRLASPLLNTYLLVIITSALTLGKLATLAEMLIIVACFNLLGDYFSAGEVSVMRDIGSLSAQLAPMILVAYVTTMFSADIRYGLNKARLLAETDELTGVYNRRGFAILADRLFSQSVRYNRPITVMLIDLDQFKEVNDSYGHGVGDRMLRLVTGCIQAALRNTDVLARHGGDEFIVLLPETVPDVAIEVAERIRASVEKTPLDAGARSLISSVSVGLAGYPEDGQTIDTIISRADHAMYKVKQQGRNGVLRFHA